jgi:NADPH:quinone reductase-like Zn-dependent oxidoreductase
MRAVQITRFGGPEVLDVVDPVPGEGQQLYEVYAASVNFAETPGRRHTSLDAMPWVQPACISPRMDSGTRDAGAALTTAAVNLYP